MAMQGFFTRTQLKTGSQTQRSKEKPSEDSAKRLRQLGLAGVKDMNPRARHPNMPPSGPDDPILYYIGEGPGQQEDEKGEPFVGKSGQFLRSAIPKKWLPHIRFDNVVRTRPVDSNGKNRSPEYHEIEGFRYTIEDSIAAAQPWAVVGFGNIPLAWATGETSGITKNRGRRFTVKIKDHVCWFYPVMHPSHLLRMNSEDNEGGVSPEEWQDIFRKDVARPCIDYKTDPDTKPRYLDPNQLLKQVEIYHGGEKDLLAIGDFLKQNANVPVGLDIETSTLRPYSPKAKILSIAIASRERCISFALDHRYNCWSAEQRKSLLAQLWTFLTGTNRKIVHNLSFDMEWLLHQFGEGVIWSKWDDTMVQTYHLDSQCGQSLDYLCNLNFGVHLKGFSNLDRANLDNEKLEKVLQYNGLDSLYTIHLFDVQRDKLKKVGLLDAHNYHIQRIPSLVLAQSKGLLVDSTQVKKYQQSLSKEIADTESAIAALPCVADYRKLFGPFDPNKPNHLSKMLRDVLHRKEGEREGGKYSTDKKVLAEIQDVPVVDLTLKLRETAKLKSTYVDPLDPKFESAIIHGDGRVHTIFNHTRTLTRRLSSDSPNLQNYPKRRNADIRSCITAGPDSVLIACDYGALEARGLAMASKDKNLTDAMWTGYDIHLEWSKRIIKAYDKTFKKRGSDLDSFRSEIKNQMVFPAFYGAGVYSIARSLEMPQEILKEVFGEFWDIFSGVKNWQNRIAEGYKKNGYVETLTGFRRYGPMSLNMQINTPIQGTGSDIVVDSMTRLARRAFDEERPYLAASLNVHDDLTFISPIQHAGYTARTAVEEMTKKVFDFINVPLVVEMSVGKNWHQMHKVGKFRTDEGIRLPKI